MVGAGALTAEDAEAIRVDQAEVMRRRTEASVAQDVVDMARKEQDEAEARLRAATAKLIQRDAASAKKPRLQQPVGAAAVAQLADEQNGADPSARQRALLAATETVKRARAAAHAGAPGAGAGAQS